LGLKKHVPKIGDKFGRLTIKEIFFKEYGGVRRKTAKCDCDCGGECVVILSRLKLGFVKSCGCYYTVKDKAGNSVESSKHGDYNKRLYKIYNSTKNRCKGKTKENYDKYKSRGISLCEEWKNNYVNFRSWSIENGYTDDLILERIDTKLGYSPDNCRWVTWQTKSHNTDRNIFLTLDGETKIITDWARDKRCSVSAKTINFRISRGWSDEEAITIPKGGVGPNRHNQNRHIQNRTRPKCNHGLSHTNLHAIWSGMRSRCNQVNAYNYPRYGGRGITICDEWENDFVAFYEWATHNGYEDGLTIDRIDNDGNYCPENCRWATHAEQNDNRPSNFLITAFGETKRLSDWAKDERCVVTRRLIRLRIKQCGWQSEKAIITPRITNKKPAPVL
jgi:hypothetical protein